MNERWRWRGQVALLAVCLAFVIYPVLPNEDVINSDWPAFATGAQMIVADPQHMYDLHVQERYQRFITGGRTLVTPGIEGILPFLAPPWVALLAVPFDVFGTDLGGRLWVLFGLACLGCGLYLATGPPHSRGGGAQRRWGLPPAVLPAFASVPTAVMMLNAQLAGIVALGIGAAIALRSRPYLAGLALGLTLMKPQLVLPLGVAVILARRWKLLAGWATAGVALLAPTLFLNPSWIAQWLAQTRATVAPISREVDLPHFGVLLPGPLQSIGVAALTVIAIAIVVILAWRRRDDFAASVAVLVAGGVLAAPHALPADLVLVAVALVVWGRAQWFDWLALSLGALVCATTVAPVPAVVGVLVVGWVCLRASGVTSRSPAPAPAWTR